MFARIDDANSARCIVVSPNHDAVVDWSVAGPVRASPQPAGSRRGGVLGKVQLACIAATLLFVYRQSLLGYLADQHYQEHFLYLWAFLALALWRSLIGPFRRGFGLASGRDRLGVGLTLLASLLLVASDLAGSTTGMRTSLVLFLSGCAVLVVTSWSVNRCLLHGLLMLLCFGIPYSVYFPLTSSLQWGVASVIAWPATMGWADYTVDSTVVLFPHYQLAITPDCSGLGQLLTFVGIAALGVLSSARRGARTVLVFSLAIVLAWLSNLVRVGVFVLLVGLGWTGAIESEVWHASIGFLVFFPFVVALVAVILKTHTAPTVHPERSVASGRFAVAWLLVPVLLAHYFGLGRPDQLPEPRYFAALASPPQHRLELRAPSESSDRLSYATPWLINARMRRDDEAFFDLLHYATSSSSHLCVHKVAACLYAPGQRVSYRPPVLIDGRHWWPISLDAEEPANSMHIYFAFEVGGVRCDDSAATQWEVFRQRILFGVWEVRLTRVILAGTLPPAPTVYEQEVLTWLGRTIDEGR